MNWSPFKKLLEIIAWILLMIVLLSLDFAIYTAHWTNMPLFLKHQLFAKFSIIGVFIRIIVFVICLYLMLVAITLEDTWAIFKVAKHFLIVKTYLMKHRRVTYIRVAIIRVGDDEPISDSGGKSIETNTAHDELEDDSPSHTSEPNNIRDIKELDKIRQTFAGKQIYDKYRQDENKHPKKNYFMAELNKQFKDHKPKPTWDHFSKIWKVIRESVPEEETKGGRDAQWGDDDKENSASSNK